MENNLVHNKISGRIAWHPLEYKAKRSVTLLYLTIKKKTQGCLIQSLKKNSKRSVESNNKNNCKVTYGLNTQRIIILLESGFVHALKRLKIVYMHV